MLRQDVSTAFPATGVSHLAFVSLSRGVCVAAFVQNPMRVT